MILSTRTQVFAACALAACVGAARASQVKLNAALAYPLLRAGEKQTTYLKVGLTGFHLESEQERPPVNLAIVIDKSGSMQGEKIRKAKEAAQMAIERLGRRDIVSVVAYSHIVQVLTPATRLTDKSDARAAIRAITAGGNTALFAGVSQGAAEVRKFLDRSRVNRVILLSDGLANVGPSSPHELACLGASLAKEGVSVTTIGLGLGYNEDLMTQLAMASDGNHYFAENAADLAKVFDRELGDVLTVVAQEVTVRIQCAPGVRPVRVLGRPADIAGQLVAARLNQLYSDQEKYVLLEIETPAAPAGSVQPIATVTVSYHNMETGVTDRLASRLQARFVASREQVEAAVNREVAVDAVQQIANERSREAVRLRDKGQISQAKKLLLFNKQFLQYNARKYKSRALDEFAAEQTESAKNLSGASWIKQRKKMRAAQAAVQMQQQMRQKQ